MKLLRLSKEKLPKVRLFVYSYSYSISRMNSKRSFALSVCKRSTSAISFAFSMASDTVLIVSVWASSTYGSSQSVSILTSGGRLSIIFSSSLERVAYSSSGGQPSVHKFSLSKLVFSLSSATSYSCDIKAATEACSVIPLLVIIGTGLTIKSKLSFNSPVSNYFSTTLSITSLTGLIGVSNHYSS